jgi:flagellar basal-body rod modification protein FlgD
MSASSTSSTSSSSTSSTISANDFLTLLVTEMQNQDPTSTADPNEYINQLVNVNSLEQLVNINQTLTTAYGSSSSSTSTSSAANAAQAAAATPQTGTAAALQKSQDALTANSVTATTPTVGGNLGLAQVNSSSQTVAHALDGHSTSKTLGQLNPLR